MSLTLQRIEGLAPDQDSLTAARNLLKPSSWPTLAEGEGLIWATNHLTHMLCTMEAWLGFGFRLGVGSCPLP